MLPHEKTLIEGLEEKNLFRRLAHVIHTSSGDRKIPVSASKGTASWIDEEEAYPEPVITVTGNGDITLMVGMQIIELTDVDDEITIDSVLQEVYSGNGSCNEKMEGDFPLLVPGTNAVSWSGDVTSVVVTPNWRTL